MRSKIFPWTQLKAPPRMLSSKIRSNLLKTLKPDSTTNYESAYESTASQEQLLEQTPLSERIVLALSRMKRTEEHPDEGVDMSDYFKTVGEVCFACLGGWALIGRLSLSSGWMKNKDMQDIASHTNVSFWTLGNYGASLDKAKDGNTYEAFVMMNLDPIKGLKYNCRITSYHLDPEAFYRDMYQLAERLRQDGY